MILEKIDKYLVKEAVLTDKKYQCISGKRGCYWTGDEPIREKNGKFRCPVCGGDAAKTPRKD